MSEAFYTDKRQVRRAFDRAAASYDGAAVLQREVADRMLERLELVKLEPGRMLDAGCGTGYAGPKLRTRFPDARLVELDLALSMLKLAAGKVGLLGRVLGRGNWQVCADLESLPLADGSLGLLWSSLAIQWLNEPDRAFREFHRVLRPEGLLMFSTFGPDTLMELRGAFAAADDKPHVNRFIDMHDLGDALSHAGFSAPVMDMEKIVLTYADVRDVMRDLKAIGAHNVAVGRGRGLMGKQAFARAEAAYEKLRRDGRLPATYEVVYGHAWKPAPKPGFADGRQVIEFRPRPQGRQ
ncbi:malonyl-ACP O-methyltransferase BioC [Chitinimonas koreensis]|uniref:malonyl-ACP O-methyltransferase BioC n=1 Tax=Chitinimonas koreensis TaxID=356302 RepID=UPI00040DB250|nr:malonyl-ACP O-methyltransferase BioC [Chitinimonas koreensis]QNM96098.1 malonyl-ACP O-methyltransferase BioC [Chitinimonas koreensis]